MVPAIVRLKIVRGGVPTLVNRVSCQGVGLIYPEAG